MDINFMRKLRILTGLSIIFVLLHLIFYVFESQPGVFLFGMLAITISTYSTLISVKELVRVAKK